ncbi:uncharacterized protein LOC129779727 isoform X2 [Toxorhynchites rutilus septentrionalis]|uniref:uncharacterized protein LOC129779727 isoform X2 n=1 Tax=Toxorhynchites rutilus septentrionalis TaxID=329112 RepID=UPI00247A604E|nr:uncharacterized protein LOC129779727 isoform X2 [Toxorhynchites rutilus septentrionalis]
MTALAVEPDKHPTSVRGRHATRKSVNIRSQMRSSQHNRPWLSPRTSRLSGNMFLLITAAAAAVMSTFAIEFPTTGAVQLRCTHHDEFYYANPATKCSTYYRCFQQQPIRYKCHEKSVFDFYQQKCVRNEGTCYEPICTGKTNGIYADTTQACRRSYECFGGKLIAMDNCPQGHLFDGSRCAPQHEVNCESPTTSAIAIPFGGDDRCYGLHNGNHIIDEDQCKKFMVCQDNSVIDVLECPFGYVYDELKARCTFTGGVGASMCMSNYMDEEDDACERLFDGLHLDPTSKSCKSYIKCLDGKFISRHDCPKAMVFNGAQCVPDFLYHCPRLALPGDICDKKMNGYYVDPRKGCSYYVRCENQKTIENHSCPSGFQYDSVKNLCVEHFHSEMCQEYGYSRDCAQRSAGFYQDFSESSKCAQYYYCLNGNKTIFRCPAGHMFDGENCVSSSTYACPSEKSDSCANKPNGHYRDPNGGCRSYFYCSNGSKTSYLCNAGHVFSDGKCVDRFNDTSCQDDLVCSGRSDGYYQDLEANCRNYFYCQGNEKLQTLTCRGSKIFNGHSCVSEDAYTCPRGRAAANPLLNCVARSCIPHCSKNGFQTDYDSGCRNYHFCIDAKKTVLSCSDNYIFNGEICVPSDTYICPKYCDATVACR